MIKHLFLPILGLFLLISCNSKKEEALRYKTLVVVLDGMRPDYISEKNTPFLHKMKQEGVYNADHHAAFPSVTRVNSSSYATGAFPQTHGLLGNSVYLAEAFMDKVINTGNAQELVEAGERLSGGLLTTPSFGELLEEAGLKYMVFSTGTTGQSFLLNHLTKGGGLVNPDLFMPEDLEADLTQKLGTIPEKETPNEERHKWVVEAFKALAFEEDGPDVCTMWLSDPDGTAHTYGVGAPETLSVMQFLDGQVRAIWEHVESMGWQDRFHLIVTADHGFVTHKGNPGLGNWLKEKGVEAVVAGGAIYLKDERQKEEVVAGLQREPWVGALFTSAKENGNWEGEVPGTLSFETIQWGHRERKSSILVDMNWSDETNEFGFKGYSHNNGVAGHGTSSPYEMHPPLMAIGPLFKEKYQNQLPTAIVDILPTVLKLHGIAPAKDKEGRVMTELLKDNGEDLPDYYTDSVFVESTHSWGTYSLGVVIKNAGNHYYMDHTITRRRIKP